MKQQIEKQFQEAKPARLNHQVSLAALRSESGNGYLAAVEAQLQTLLDGGNDSGKTSAEGPPSAKRAAKEGAAVVKTVIQGLRLFACIFRSSLRRSAKFLWRHTNKKP